MGIVLDFEKYFGYESEPLTFYITLSFLIMFFLILQLRIFVEFKDFYIYLRYLKKHLFENLLQDQSCYRLKMIIYLPN